MKVPNCTTDCPSSWLKWFCLIARNECAPLNEHLDRIDIEIRLRDLVREAHLREANLRSRSPIPFPGERGVSSPPHTSQGLRAG